MAKALKRLQGFLLVSTNAEQLRQLEDGENLAELFIDAAQHEPPAIAPEHLVHGDECSQHRRAQLADERG